MENQPLPVSDRKHRAVEPSLRGSTAGPSRKISSKKKKKVRWADEQSQKPAIIAVMIINGLCLVLGVLSQLGLWAKNDEHISGPVELEVRDAVHMPPQLHAVHDLRPFKRDVPGANDTAMHSFQVGVPLLRMNGKVVGGGTADGYNGAATILPGLGEEDCQVTIAVDTFSDSFGSPFVGNYTPPACLAGSNTAIMNLTVQSQGRQFDRLGIV